MANISKSSSKLRILYAEGDSEVLASQSVTIEKAGYQVTQAEGRKQVQDTPAEGKIRSGHPRPHIDQERPAPPGIHGQEGAARNAPPGHPYRRRRSSRGRCHPGDRPKHERPPGKDRLVPAPGGRCSLRPIGFCSAVWSRATSPRRFQSPTRERRPGRPPFSF